MLRYLKVKDVALLEEVEIEFHHGLNLITGETGAGKSLIVDSIQLLTGIKSSPDYIREGKESALIEGIFEFEQPDIINKYLEYLGIIPDDQLILKREIHKTKKQKCFINNQITSINAFKTLSTFIIDIYGQHEHQSLLLPDGQLQYLDAISNNQDILKSLNEIVSNINNLTNIIKKLEMDEVAKEQKIDYLKFKINEIKSANLHPNEENELLAKRKVLVNYEQIVKLCQSIIQLLSESDNSLISSTTLLNKQFDELNRLTENFVEYKKQIEPFKFVFQDLSIQINNYLSKIHFDPYELQHIEEKLNIINKLKKKYGSSIEEILNELKSAEEELVKLEEIEINIASYKKELDTLINKYRVIAEELSKNRKKGAELLEKLISKELPQLALEKCNFEVRLREKMPQQGESVYISEYGYDECEFLIEPNPGEGMHPLSRIASGGELSRLMLALKTCSSETTDKTLIFDEIDTGIGGITADIIAKKLKKLSKKQQIICVTHLPQIAAYADHHYNIYKKTENERTITIINELKPEERVKEIVRMLGASVSSSNAVSYAESLLKVAES